MIDNFDNYLFRAHAVGKIMTDPKGKHPKIAAEEAREVFRKKLYTYQETKNKETETAKKLLKSMDALSAKIDKFDALADQPWLSGTCKAHLANLFVAAVYDRHEDFFNKYMTKGLMVEEDVITQYCLLTSNMAVKNTVRLKNEFVEGENDFMIDDVVLDAKAKWSIFQFTRDRVVPIDPIYHWQLDCYMWLFNKPKARLVQGLVNTPEKLILKEEKELLYKFIGTEEDYKAACAELRRNHTYDDIPLDKKMNWIDVKRSDERIELIKARVTECRNYMNGLLTNNLKLTFEEDTEDET